MQAKDIMTTNVTCVAPDAKVNEIAELLLARHVSGVPVVDGSNRLLGVVSEGDLMRRPEVGNGRPRSWWLHSLLAPDSERISEFLRSHGRRAEDVMSRKVISVSEDTPVAEVARLLESHRIKRVPVLRDKVVVGIVSRADLIRGLATAPAQEVASDDTKIRAAIGELVKKETWMTHGCLNATVSAGDVELWGWAESENERKAIQLAVEDIPGVGKVTAHIGLIAPYLRGV